MFGNKAHEQTEISPSHAKLRSLAFVYLAKRDYAEHELAQKLMSSGANEAEVAELIAEFVATGYVNNQRCADVLVRKTLRTGKGPLHLQQKAQQRHLDLQQIKNTSDTVDWLEQASNVRIHKFGEELPTDTKDKARQLRFLQSRGFDFATALRATQTNPTADE